MNWKGHGSRRGANIFLFATTALHPPQPVEIIHICCVALYNHTPYTAQSCLSSSWHGILNVKETPAERWGGHVHIGAGYWFISWHFQLLKLYNTVGSPSYQAPNTKCRMVEWSVTNELEMMRKERFPECPSRHLSGRPQKNTKTSVR
jgi:hypothetical protein